jgi:hypothetical protein
MKSITFFSFVLLFGFFACKDSIVSSNEFQSGTFSYIAYDTLSTITTTGSLILTRSDSKISGTWNFSDGRSGDLVGKIDKDSIELELYPGFADHNLTLTGKFSNNTYTGEWILYGWAILGRGTFKASMK